MGESSPHEHMPARQLHGAFFVFCSQPRSNNTNAAHDQRQRTTSRLHNLVSGGIPRTTHIRPNDLPTKRSLESPCLEEWRKRAQRERLGRPLLAKIALKAYRALHNVRKQRNLTSTHLSATPTEAKRTMTSAARRTSSALRMQCETCRNATTNANQAQVKTRRLQIWLANDPPRIDTTMNAQDMGATPPRCAG